MPNPTNPNTILLKGEMGCVYGEGNVKSGATIYPGQFIEPYTTAPDTYDRLTWQLQSSAGQLGPCVVAIEEALTGAPDSGFGATIDDPYDGTTHKVIRFHKCEKNDRIYAFLAAGESVTPADRLTFDGSGDLKKIGTGNATDGAVARSVEVKDNSLGGTHVRIRVEII